MKKILIIEDERSTSDVLSVRLNAEGYNIVTAYDGKSGWSKVASEKPDLIILDIGLPVIDGVTLCDLIKKDKRYAKIPVIMLTARKTIGDWEDGLNAGADTYLNKPYNWNELIANVAGYIEK